MSFIKDFCNEFGYTDSTGIKAYKACKKTYNAIHRLFTDEEIEKLIQERQDARKAKNFARADEIRDMLAAQGITLKDTPQGVQVIRK